MHLCSTDDVAGVTTSPTSGLQCTEVGGTATFSLVLTSEPISEVTIGVSSDDTTEGNLGSVVAVTFTAVTWSTPQTVTIFGVNDDVMDGDIAFSVIVAAATSGDTNYHALIDGSDVGVTTVNGTSTDHHKT